MRLILLILSIAGLIAGCSSKEITFVPAPTIFHFASSASSILLGDNTVVTPLFSDGTGSIDQGVGAVTSGLSYAVSPSADAIYTLRVVNAAGAAATAELAVEVDNRPAAIRTFAAWPEQVGYGEASMLSWTIEGRARRLLLGGVSVLGRFFETIHPVRRQAFVLVSANAAGSDTRTVTVAARGLDLVAGNPDGYPGSADAIGSEARFRSPEGVAVDGSGNVFVADSGNHSIRKITSAGVVTTLAGLAGIDGSSDGTGREALFHFPTNLAVDDSGNIYVADFFNSTVRKVSAAGAVSTFAGKAGEIAAVDGPPWIARFRGPWGVAADRSGNVYVSDSLNHTVRKISAVAVTTIAGSAGVAGDIDGRGSDARFDFPSGIAVDDSGNVYVANGYGHTIRKIDPQGYVFTLAGFAYQPGNRDGTGTEARFHSPNGIAVDRAGNVFVADSGNSSIRKITPGGAVTTIAGSLRAEISLGPLPASLSFPAGMAITPAGDLIVTSQSLVLQITAP